MAKEEKRFLRALLFYDAGQSVHVHHDFFPAHFIGEIADPVQRSGGLPVSPVIVGVHGISRFGQRVGKALIPGRVLHHSVGYLDGTHNS